MNCLHLPGSRPGKQPEMEIEYPHETYGPARGALQNWRYGVKVTPSEDNDERKAEYLETLMRRRQWRKA